MRLEHWERDLVKFLEAAKEKQFQYGTWDCCIFAADAVQILRGVDPAAPLRVYKNKDEAARIIKKYGSLENMAVEIARQFGFQEIAPAFAQRGDIVYAKLSGGTLGVCIGSSVVFPTVGKGVVEFPLLSDALKRGWRIE